MNAGSPPACISEFSRVLKAGASWVVSVLERTTDRGEFERALVDSLGGFERVDYSGPEDLIYTSGLLN